MIRRKSKKCKCLYYYLTHREENGKVKYSLRITNEYFESDGVLITCSQTPLTINRCISSLKIKHFCIGIMADATKRLNLQIEETYADDTFSQLIKMCDTPDALKNETYLVLLLEVNIMCYMDLYIGYL